LLGTLIITATFCDELDEEHGIEASRRPGRHEAEGDQGEKTKSVGRNDGKEEE
jgi:hypothetical protein